MKRLFLLAAFIGLLGTLLLAADLTGKWAGQFDFNGTAVPVTLSLKTTGNSVTGTVGDLPTDNAEIKEGKIDGDKITFWVVTDYQGDSFKLVWTGKITADQIDFNMGTEDGSFGVTFPVKKSTS